MNFNKVRAFSFLGLCALLVPALFAQTAATNVAELVTPAPVTESSSSSPTLDLSTAATATAAKTPAPETATKPFSAVGVDVKIGTGGIGFDIATPLARKFNLRGTGYFFKYNVSITEDYVTYGGSLQLASGALNLDWYPFGGKFRLSGGIVAYNGNQITGSATINPYESFTLNGTTYYSSATDPAHASGTLYLGNKVGPIVSFGWGNIVPRKANKHFSVPVEFGVAYVGYPNIHLGFTGSTCNSLGTACQTVEDNPTFQQDLAAQRNQYRNDLSALRFYPVVSIGFGYKF